MYSRTETAESLIVTSRYNFSQDVDGPQIGASCHQCYALKGS